MKMKMQKSLIMISANLAIYIYIDKHNFLVFLLLNSLTFTKTSDTVKHNKLMYTFYLTIYLITIMYKN